MAENGKVLGATPGGVKQPAKLVSPKVEEVKRQASSMFPKFVQEKAKSA